MKLLELSSLELETYLKNDDRAIIALGSCEQHGPRGFIGTDYITAHYLATSLAEQRQIVQLPSLSLGMSIHHQGFTGTISLTPETYIRVISELLAEVYRNGFRRLLIINGHGGNVSPFHCAFLSLEQNLHSDFKVSLQNWYELSAVKQLLQDLFQGREGSHGTPGELSLAAIVAGILPSKSKVEFSEEYQGVDIVYNPLKFRKTYPEGTVGADQNLASREAGYKIAETALIELNQVLDLL